MKNKFKYLLLGLVLLVALVLIFVISAKMNKFTDNDLKIYCFNAGKADSCLVSVDGKHMLIDTGEKKLGDQIISYLNNNNIKKLDYLVITHFDKDHVGGAAKVIDAIEIDKIFQNGYPTDNKQYENYIDALSTKNIDVVTVTSNEKIAMGNLKMTIMGTNAIFDNNESNNSSLVISMEYKHNRFLFTGDIQNERIKDFLKEDTSQYDFVKIPYHGHYQKRLAKFLESTKPKYALITSSDKEKEDQETVNLLKNLGVKYYLTREGAVTIRSNGNKIIIEQ